MFIFVHWFPISFLIRISISLKLYILLNGLVSLSILLLQFKNCLIILSGA